MSHLKITKPSKETVINIVITLLVALALLGVAAGVTFGFHAYRDYQSKIRIDSIQEVNDVYKI